jgi:formate hydrogenlyase subunit 6/NADH:ubiquinone oxidoreductase subunit I
MSQPKGYWGNIVHSTRSLWSGLMITWIHILKARKSQHPISIQDDNYFTQTDGVATIQYPHVSLPVPDTGRYRLHNEIDDCIVCDKCVNVCPVDCITIEPIKATEEHQTVHQNGFMQLNLTLTWENVVSADYARPCARQNA